MFTPIDLTTWPRREHFRYYREALPCGYTVTVRMDVTRFHAMLRTAGLRFYPAFVWCVSHTILTHPAFRMGVDAVGNPGYYAMLHPNYTIFHEDDHTFSDLWTPHNEDFSLFYSAMLADMAQYGSIHKMRIRPDMPANFYCISCVPWLDFEGYSAFVPQGLPNLFPVMTYGKITPQDGRETLPLAINIAHASADGWHASEFYRDLQTLLDEVQLSR